MAHDAMRTWILVALRAATEPVKEEAKSSLSIRIGVDQYVPAAQTKGIGA